MKRYKTPTKDQVQVVIDLLELYEKKNPHSKIYMANPFVNVCGTPMCHGGSFLIAHTYWGLDISQKDITTQELCFNDGANLMASYLGFENMHDLEIYAGKHPKWWGNEQGDGMFCINDAFSSEKRPAGAQNLQDIIDHWKEVQTRSK